MKEIRFMECHSEIFHAGKNFGKKLMPQDRHRGLSLLWDEDKHRFEIVWENRKAYLPESSALIWEVNDGTEIGYPKNEHQTHDITKVINAQVSTPHGHVFEGLGAGKAGRGKTTKVSA